MVALFYFYPISQQHTFSKKVDCQICIESQSDGLQGSDIGHRCMKVLFLRVWPIRV